MNFLREPGYNHETRSAGALAAFLMTADGFLTIAAVLLNAIPGMPALLYLALERRPAYLQAGRP